MDNTKIVMPSNNKFGYFFTIVFFIFSLYFYNKNQITISFIFVFVFVLTLIITLIKPNLLYIFNFLWFKLGITIGKFVSPIVLMIFYFLLITPIAIISKLFNRDVLNLNFKTNDSNWKKRLKNDIKSSSFKNQY